MTNPTWRDLEPDEKIRFCTMMMMQCLDRKTMTIKNEERFLFWSEEAKKVDLEIRNQDE